MTVAHPKAKEILGQFGFLADYGRQMEVPEGFVVIRDGDAAGSMFFILDGLVEVTKDERLLAVLEPGEVFGEMSLVDGRPRSANVAALQATQLIRIDRDEFEQAGSQKPAAPIWKTLSPQSGWTLTMQRPTPHVWLTKPTRFPCSEANVSFGCAAQPVRTS